MIKIRIFRFEDRLYSTEQIENTLNNFSQRNDVISIAVNTINNGCRNDVDLVYTITYKED